MNLSFDEESQKLINQAKEEMFNLRHPYVGSEHLLLAILKNKNLKEVTILKTYGITYERFYKELVNIIGIGKKNNKWFLFTPMLKRILENAENYSGNNVITPRCLLISLLSEGDGIANRVLCSLNIDSYQIYDNFITNNKKYYNLEKPVLLEELAINMNEKSAEYDPVYGRDEEINSVIRILLRKNKSNPLLLGETGVGKTAIVEELARRIVNGEVPFKLKKLIIYNLPLSTLIAGTKYRGEFEEKLQKVVQEIKNNHNIVLFIDEIHTIIGAGSAEGSIDAANILKPYLARNDIRVIGSTTIEEYNRNISKDLALARRFQQIYIDELSVQETKNVLLKLKDNYQIFHNVEISRETIDKLVEISNGFIFNRNQPDKAIDLLDEVCTYSSLKNQTNNEEKELNLEILKLEKAKNIVIKKKNLEEALKITSREKSLLSKINFDTFCSQKRINITEKDIYDVIYKKTKIPVIEKEYKTSELKLLRLMPKQRNNIKEIIKVLKKIDYKKRNVPAVITMKGKKLEEIEKVLEILIEELYSSQLIKIDVANYRKAKELLENEFSLLKNSQQTFPVFSIKNIDKCHREVSDYLFKSFSEGCFMSNNYNKYYIKKSLIFLIINNENNQIGFNSSKPKKEYLNAIKVIGFN